MTGLLTGHVFTTDLVDSTVCDRYKQTSETVSHVLCDCEALAVLGLGIWAIIS
jgi:hypothetical protein